MSLEGFHLLDVTSIDISNIKRNYMKINRQQGAQLSNSNYGIDFIFG